ncbi:tetratricopeptide repeat protein [Sulfurospirillum sp. 1612]|uniref:tetratricopeptide repeat protein n=1 Tax=Sulfurospirillum sp. 1612 TaxID=3094835 RepID=UPI002F94D5EE
MTKRVLFLILLPWLAFANEPSVYGAGNLDSPNPYGLSQSEKKIFSNMQNIKRLEKAIKILQINSNDQKERFEGIRSVTESISNKIGQLDKRLFTLESQDENRTDSLRHLKDEIATLQSDLNASVQAQIANQDKVKNVLSELSSLIDSINSTYISKDEFQKFKDSVNQKLSTFKKSTTRQSFSGKNKASLEKKAAQLVRKKSYAEAKDIYTFLVKQRYHPAGNSFRLGEIAYAQKSYADAILHYKKSISLYDKASYVPVLLYHTGISLSKLKRHKEASKFFNALQSNYPNSKEAKSLKK